MWSALSERRRWALVALAAALLLVALDAWWVATFRDGYPLDVDEAGYTSFALQDYFALDKEGLGAWWETIQSQAPNAPLVPALTSLVFLIKPGVMGGFVVLAGFLVLLALASYGIGERLAGPRLGALAAVVVLTLPGTFLNLREYIFALPAAALLACAVFSMLRSDGFQRIQWSIACGAFIGLMLLARTMTAAFVPGLLAAGLVPMLARRADWRLALMNLAALAAAAFAVAASWYWKNLQPVLDYLTDFGYGSKSTEFGEDQSPLSWVWWKDVAMRMTSDDLLLPLAFLVLAALISLVVLAARRVGAAGDRRAALEELLSTDAISVVIVVVAGYLALSTSSNAGNGFTFPLAVLLPPLAVIALRHYRRALLPVFAALIAVTVLNVVSTSTVSEDLSETRSVSVPAFGALPWVRGEPKAVNGMRQQIPGPGHRFNDRDAAWLEVDSRVARLIVEELGGPLSVFGMRNRVLNTNTVNLAALLSYQYALPLTQLVADEGDSAPVYARKLLDPEFGLPSVLLTTDTEIRDYEPVVTQDEVEAAARRVGFHIVHRIQLPDGRELRIWQKRDAADIEPA